MLQAIREKLSGWVLIVIVLILAIPFALFGVNSYFDTNIPTYVAKVGETEISPDEVRAEIERERNQYRQMFGPDQDLSFLNTPERKRAALDRLVDRALLRIDAKQAGISVPAERLRKQILEESAFSVAGQFDVGQYQRILAANGLTPAGFEARLVDDLLTTQISNQLRESSILSDADVDNYVRLRDQTRTFSFVTLLGATATIDEEVTDEQAQAYFDAHSAEYQRPQRVMVDYVEIKGADLVAEQQPSEDDLRTLYAEQSARFVVPETRLSSHILIALAAGADADAERAGLAKAEAIKARIDAGEDFAAVATEVSEDAGSAPQGGDLGWLELGLTDPAFEAALFELDANAISAPVRSADGYHLIQLREIKPEQAKSFDEARAELETEWIDTQRFQAFNDISGQLVDQTTSYPKSLQRAAEKVKLPVLQSPLFEEHTGEGVFANPVVRQAAFKETAIKRRNVSEPIEVADEHLIVLQVVEHKPSETKSLEEVREQVVAGVLSERRAAALASMAATAAEQLKGGQTLADWASSAELSPTVVEAAVRTAANQDPRITAEVFKLSRPDSGPVRDVLKLSEQEWVAIELTAVTNGDPQILDEAGRDAVRSQLNSHWAALESAGYLEYLRSVTEVTINEKLMP